MCAAEVTSPVSTLKIPAMAFCSVCLDAVVEGGGRSTARLTCGHSFHLDCIGSAFNAKGRMQCPNCRDVEQGRWLYANACCLNEDLVEDTLFEYETEVYRTAGVLLNHSPWCPHQGLYEHTSLTFEELMNLGHGYADFLRSPLRMRRMFPYLVGVHNSPRQSPPAHNGSWAPNGGSFWRYNHNSPSLYPNHSHQVDQVAHRHLHPHSGSLVWNGHTNNRRARHGELSRTTTHPHNYYGQRVQMSEPTLHGHPSWVSAFTSQRPSMGPYIDGMHWAAVGPHISYGVPVNWWTWDLFATDYRNMAANPTRRGQSGSALRTAF